jgi:hypothetical protein
MYQKAACPASRELWEHHVVKRLGPRRRDDDERERLEQAVAAVDRELAANLELTSMFDQTHQAVVLETGEFERHRETLATGLGEAFTGLADVYDRVPAAESAMERRGPANTLRDEDRLLIETWEGDARSTQRAVRSALSSRPRSPFAAVLARLRGMLPSRR